MEEGAEPRRDAGTEAGIEAGKETGCPMDVQIALPWMLFRCIVEGSWKELFCSSGSSLEQSG